MTELPGDLSVYEDARDPDGQPYPPWASTDEERRRWDYSLDMASKLFGEGDDSLLGSGPTPSSSADIPMAARSIFFSDIPTGDPPEAVKAGHPLAQQAQQAEPDVEPAGEEPAAPESTPAAPEESSEPPPAA